MEQTEKAEVYTGLDLVVAEVMKLENIDEALAEHEAEKAEALTEHEEEDAKALTERKENAEALTERGAENAEALTERGAENAEALTERKAETAALIGREPDNAAFFIKRAVDFTRARELKERAEKMAEAFAEQEVESREREAFVERIIDIDDTELEAERINRTFMGGPVRQEVPLSIKPSSVKGAKIGVRVKNEVGLKELVNKLPETGFNFVCFDLVSEDILRANDVAVEPKESLSWSCTPSSLLLSSTDWREKCVSVIIGTTRHDANATPELITSSRLRLIGLQLDYAIHLGTTAMFELDEPSLDQISRILTARIIPLEYENDFCPIWVVVNVTDDEEGDESEWKRPHFKSDKRPSSSGSWDLWNKLRSLCDYSPSLFVVLRLPGIKQKRVISEKIVKQWLAEPLAAIIISKDYFKEEDVKVKCEYTKLIDKLRLEDTRIIIEDMDMSIKDELPPCLGCWANRQTKPKVVRPETYNEKMYPIGCRPLNPRTTLGMEKFMEKDGAKFHQYQRAFTKIMNTKFKDQKSLTIVMIDLKHWGLMKVLTRAASACDFKGTLNIFIIQKNEHILQILKSFVQEKESTEGAEGENKASTQKEKTTEQKHETTKGKNDKASAKKEKTTEQEKDKIKSYKINISFVLASVFDWQTDVKTDLAICDALGSFGCNLLLPETFEAAKKFLKESGEFIPQGVTSFMQPISSNRFYTSVMNGIAASRPPNYVLETPVKAVLSPYFEIADPKPLFAYRFEMGWEGESERHVFKTLRFQVQINSLLHGFAGYFKASLFTKIQIDTVPNKKGEGSKYKSWLPAFFPLKAPVLVQKGDEIEVLFWRESGDQNMWYEWTLAKPLHLPIHNVGGRFYSVEKERSKVYARSS